MDKERHFWPLMALALLVGIGVGLLLAWQVWPVNWYDTDPSDLRQDHQMAYIALVADSLVVTGDAAAAQRQLYELVDDDTSPDEVGALVNRTMTNLRAEGNQAAALRVQRMIQQVGLPALPDAASPTPAPTEAPKERKPIPTRYLYGGAIALFVTALALAVWGIMRLIRSQSESAYAADSGDDYTPPLPEGAQPGYPGAADDVGTQAIHHEYVDDPPEEPAEYPPEPESAPRQTTIGGGYAAPHSEPAAPMDTSQSDLAYGEGAAETREVDITDGLDAYPGHMDTEMDGDEPDIASSAPASPPPAPASTPGREGTPPAAQSRPAARRRGKALAVHQIHYRPSRDEIDDSFKIHSERNEYIGECDVGAAEILNDEGARRVVAVTLWLYDKTDKMHTNSTVEQILTSPYVKLNEELAARLSTHGDWAIVAPGYTRILETANMRATFTVQAVEYANDPDLPEAYFESMDVEVIVEKR